MRQRWGKGVSVAWGPAAGWYHAALGSAGPGPCALDFAPPWNLWVMPYERRLARLRAWRTAR